MPNNPAIVGDYQCGTTNPLLLIAGPCVIDDEAIAMQIAEHLVTITRNLNINLVFKASFDKANRSSIESYRGVGIEAGLRVLEKIKSTFGVPVTTDIHESYQAAMVGEVCDVLQIPAFLARQTDLLVAAAKTGRVVNVKKGQFMAPTDMKNVVNKLKESECENIMLCERGTFFGYGNLVNDMTGIPQMQDLGVPVIFDATHSVQKPGGLGKTTGGNREFVEPLARSAVAMGVDGLFFETHPEPEKSPSDGANMIPLDQIEATLVRMIKIRELFVKLYTA